MQSGRDVKVIAKRFKQVKMFFLLVNEKCAVNNVLCSTFCLPTPFGRSCACEEGVLLEKDGRTCKGGKLSITLSVHVKSNNCIHMKL